MLTPATPQRPRSRIRRVARGLGLAGLALAGWMAIGQVLIPAALTSHSFAEEVPFTIYNIQSFDDRNQFAPDSFMARVSKQLAATVESFRMGLSLDQERGRGWNLSEKDVRAFVDPQHGQYGSLQVWCGWRSDGERPHVSLDLDVAKPGFSGADAHAYDPQWALLLHEFSPLLPFVVDHTVSVEDRAFSDNPVRITHFQPFGAPPYRGGFRDVWVSQRAEAARLYPELDNMRCGDAPRLTVAEFMARFGGLEALKRWPAAGAKLPSELPASVLNRAPGEHVSVEPVPGDVGAFGPQLYLWARTARPGAQARQEATTDWLLARMAELAPLRAVLRTATDEDLRTMYTFVLKDGTVMVTSERLHHRQEFGVGIAIGTAESWRRLASRLGPYPGDADSPPRLPHRPPSLSLPFPGR